MSLPAPATVDVLRRTPSCWYFDEGELDVWKVWARVAEQLGADPARTVIAGCSMGGYAAYKLGLSYPEVFGHGPRASATGLMVYIVTQDICESGSSLSRRFPNLVVPQ
jgi:poly(3-hydroxybutyrate) depolymerase